MISIEEAKAAKQVLVDNFGNFDWFNGVGIGIDENKSYTLHVYLKYKTKAVKAIIPDKIREVPIIYKVTGVIRPL